MKDLIKGIEEIGFSNALKGYNTNEVDDYLDSLIVALNSEYVENEKIRVKLEAIQGREDSIKSMEETLKSTLVTAQATANSLVDKAVAQSDEIIANAKVKADGVLAAADRKTMDMLSESELKADQIIANARQDARDARLEYERLVRDINTSIVDYKKMLTEQIQVIDAGTVNNNSDNTRVSIVRPSGLQFAAAEPKQQPVISMDTADDEDLGETKAFSTEDRKAIIDMIKDEDSSALNGYDIGSYFKQAQKDVMDMDEDAEEIE